ncbi:MAG: MFS transporter, partial [Tannerellaceae bacterium]
LLTFTTHTVLAFIAAILMAIAMGFNNAAVFKLVPTYVPTAVGGASGWVGGLGAFGWFVIPTIMGWIVSLYGQIGYVRGFFVFIVLAIINIFILYLWLMRYKAKQVKKAH